MEQELELSATEDRLLLRDIIRSGGELDLYSVHTQYRLSAAQVASASRKLEAAGLVHVRGSVASLTPKGQKEGAGFAARLLSRKPREYWKEIPSELLRASKEENSLYCPSLLEQQDESPQSRFEDCLVFWGGKALARRGDLASRRKADVSPVIHRPWADGWLLRSQQGHANALAAC